MKLCMICTNLACPLPVKGKMKKTALLISIIFLFAVVTLGLFFVNKGSQNLTTGVLKQIKYSFTVQNKTNQLIDDGRLWIHAPVAVNSYQTCLGINSNFPYRLITMEQGNQILEFKISDLPPFATRVIQVEANIFHKEKPDQKVLQNHKKYIRSERFIESEHPDIAGLAKKLKAKNPMETAKNIYDWVSMNIEYAGHIKNNRGALYALKKRRGDCTEFMSLFIALCRANNIPARGIGGYTCRKNCVLDSGEFHNWAEFFINGSWLIADCQKKVFSQNQSDYIAMQIIFNDEKKPMKALSRFRFLGNGVKIRMN